MIESNLYMAGDQLMLQWRTSDPPSGSAVTGLPGGGHAGGGFAAGGTVNLTAHIEGLIEKVVQRIVSPPNAGCGGGEKP